MNKKERLEFVREHTTNVENAKADEDLIKELSEATGVTEATILKDIETIDNESENEGNEDTKGGKVIKVTFTQDEKDNKTLRNGRLEEYTVPKNEMNSIHVELEKTQYGQENKKVSSPFVQIFDQRAWLNFAKSARSLGYKHVRILYAPKEWNKEDLEIAEK